MRARTKHEKGFCSVCGTEVSIKQDNTVYRHGQRAGGGDCTGSGMEPSLPPEGTRERPEPGNVVKPPEPSTNRYRLVISAFVELSEGINVGRERQLLFDDPAHLYNTLDAVPNEHFALTLKRQWS